ncbi:MAG: GerMN domain-containing protein [Thermoanaerobaculia bacterium]
MTRRAAIVLLVVLLATVAGLLLLTRDRSSPEGGRRRRLFLRVTPAPAVAPNVSPAPTTRLETVRVTLFFPGAEDGKLRPEERDLARPAGAGAFLKAIVAELQKGPTQPGLVRIVPDRIRLRTAFLLPEGEVVLDLAVDAGLSFGSAEELAIIASLVNTVLQNVADTSRVRILINGEPAETLGGHLDLTRPLLYMRRELAS